MWICTVKASPKGRGAAVLGLILFSGIGCCYFEGVIAEPLGPLTKKLQSSRSLFKADNCKYDIVLNDTRNGAGYISSPDFPKKYPNDAECQWTITSSGGQRILFGIIEGKLEESKGCTYDYLELFDGINATGISLGRFCGSLERRSYLSLSNSVLVVFSADASLSESGFKLKYSLENLHDFNESCNYTVVSHNGTIYSPGFPERYPDICDCWIHIEAPNSEGRLQLQFDVLSLETSQGCNNDFVEVFDGSTVDADVLGSFCTKSPDNEIIVVSSTRRILVHFHSDNVRNFGGFSLHFSNFEKQNLENNIQLVFPRCPIAGTNTSGMFTSPNYPESYLPDINCRLILEAPETYYYIVTFEEVDLEPDDLCAFDYLEIRDGLSLDSPLLVQVCGQKENGYTITSSTNTLFVQFISDEFMEFGGFKAIYNAVLLGVENDVESQDYEELDTVHIESEDDVKYEAAEWLSHQEKHDGIAPVILADPQNATVAHGDTHSLHCFINGSNSAVIWLKDQSFLSKAVEEYTVILANNTLVITYMNIELEGVYTCVVLTEVGALSFSAWVTLMSPDSNSCSVEFRQRPVDIAVQQGEDAFLTCYAHEADIFWSKDDMELFPDENIHFLTDNIIVLSNARVNDTGVYICQAVSKTSGCSITAEAYIEVVAHQDFSKECGQPKWNHSSKAAGRGRVASGHTVEQGFFPWQAMLWERWAHSFCGGSLLTDRWVVTAAHCITEFHQRFARTLKAEYLIVRLGKHDQTRTESNEKAVGVTRIIVHPKFNSSTYDNDVALVQLSEVVMFTDYILPVCLPNGTNLQNETYKVGGIVGAVTGWGIVTERGTSPIHLQVVYVPIVKWDVCQASTQYSVTENMFCAGYDQKIMGDACHGDSGGPFTVLYNGRWSLAGLVSWGEGCDREGKYGFYTKVINFTQWIKTIIADM